MPGIKVGHNQKKPNIPIYQYLGTFRHNSWGLGLHTSCERARLPQVASNTRNLPAQSADGIPAATVVRRRHNRYAGCEEFSESMESVTNANDCHLSPTASLALRSIYMSYLAEINN
mgnify:CR=1 FL=1